MVLHDYCKIESRVISQNKVYYPEVAIFDRTGDILCFLSGKK